MPAFIIRYGIGVGTVLRKAFLKAYEDTDSYSRRIIY
jgi:hypothetical protein